MRGQTLIFKYQLYFNYRMVQSLTSGLSWIITCMRGLQLELAFKRSPVYSKGKNNFFLTEMLAAEQLQFFKTFQWRAGFLYPVLFFCFPFNIQEKFLAEMEVVELLKKRQGSITCSSVKTCLFQSITFSLAPSVVIHSLRRSWQK